jgi:hypothetical protein
MSMNDILKFAQFEKVDLLKVDIEGAEIELLGGDLAWLNHVGAIAVEFHGDSREVSRFDRIIRANRFGVRCEDRHTVLVVREG